MVRDGRRSGNQGKGASKTNESKFSVKSQHFFRFRAQCAPEIEGKSKINHAFNFLNI